jgi:hypothetical protein
LPEENGSSEDDHVDNLAAHRSQATSPLAGRGKTLAKDIRVTVPAGPGRSARQTVTEEVDRTNSPLDFQDGEEESDETEDEGSDIAKTESDIWLPASSRPWSTTAIPQNGPLPHLQQAPSPVFEKDVKARHTQARRSNKTSVSELAQDLGELNLASKKTHQPAARPTRTRQSKTVSAAEEDEEDDSIIVVQNTKGGEGQKKKKR